MNEKYCCISAVLDILPTVKCVKPQMCLHLMRQNTVGMFIDIVSHTTESKNAAVHLIYFVLFYFVIFKLIYENFKTV